MKLRTDCIAVAAVWNSSLRKVTSDRTNMKVTITKIPRQSTDDTLCERGPTVIPQLIRNDHRPLEKWKQAATIPTI
ncbi:hypothetical protein D3C81_2079960 [compost metagenome]